jgi:hypothetical protein
VRTPSSSPPSARMTTLSDINTNGHATTLPTQHCHHSTGPPGIDKPEDDAMVLQKEAPTPAPTPQACAEAPAPRGPHNWPANAALLRYVSSSSYKLYTHPIAHPLSPLTFIPRSMAMQREHQSTKPAATWPRGQAQQPQHRQGRVCPPARVRHRAHLRLPAHGHQGASPTFTVL